MEQKNGFKQVAGLGLQVAGVKILEPATVA
jgi:hypothetical protein